MYEGKCHEEASKVLKTTKGCCDSAKTSKKL